MKTLSNAIAVTIFIGALAGLAYGVYLGFEWVQSVVALLSPPSQTLVLLILAAVLTSLVAVSVTRRAVGRVRLQNRLSDHRIELYRVLLNCGRILADPRAATAEGVREARDALDALQADVLLLGSPTVIERSHELVATLQSPSSDETMAEPGEVLNELLRAMRQELGHQASLAETRLAWPARPPQPQQPEAATLVHEAT